MFIVRPIQNKEEQKSIVEQCGGVYLPEALAYAAYDCADDGKTVRSLLGVCQFSLERGFGSIGLLRYAPGTCDTEAIMIMGRAAMSFLFRCGFARAVWNDDAPTGFAEALGFRADADGIRAIDLARFFESPCHFRPDAPEGKQ